MLLQGLFCLFVLKFLLFCFIFYLLGVYVLQVASAQQGAEPSDDLQFLSKLEEVCGYNVTDILKASVVSMIEDHCKSCLSPIHIDLVSLGDLPGDFKTLFTKLMAHVYGLK